MDASAGPPRISFEDVAHRLDEDWGLGDATVASLGGGMNSQTWLVTSGERRWVAKAVDPASVNLGAGLAVASIVEAAGIPAGAPLLTRAGASTVAIDGRELALLGFVTGVELTGTDDEQPTIGRTLARVHRALAGQAVAGADQFHWLDASADHLDLRGWLRPAIATVLERWQHIPPSSLTWGLVHSDPAPEAFRYDARTGVCGLIDWDRALMGPLMYDVASAVMYGGGPARARPLLDAYTAAGGLEAPEIERTLEVMRAVRWAVQADYFAKRIATNDMTGIDDPAENEDGLRDAEEGLAETGI
ncbi:MAG TPA: phosphotransferase [Candidatus Polarisedimenticolia bacterium]|nr:phosphotransferase [Candidatus Polarisedimenticolia bacterium]